MWRGARALAKVVKRARSGSVSVVGEVSDWWSTAKITEGGGAWRMAGHSQGRRGTVGELRASVCRSIATFMQPHPETSGL
jgi:hypothetical protein